MQLGGIEEIMAILPERTINRNQEESRHYILLEEATTQHYKVTTSGEPV